MIVYTENPKQSARPWMVALELISSAILQNTRYKHRKSIIFLYTINEYVDIEFKIQYCLQLQSLVIKYDLLWCESYKTCIGLICWNLEW